MRGRASHVTDLGDGTVLRVGGDPEREARIMEHARARGFAVPAVRELRDGGMVLDRVDGPTMADELRRRPWQLPRQIRVLADLHDALHAIAYDGGSLLHFDLHPENVMLGPGGPVVIDWTNARGGNPDTDVALTWLILETSAGLPGRLAARMFSVRVGDEAVRRGLAEAAHFRLADVNVTATEKDRVRRIYGT
ncbi:MAG: phosphotransferase [Chloroflexota bacterium]|nr:phosphotransferase [Chloroflexota bacterium]